MSCKIAIKAAVVAVALGAMTNVAWAEPVKMTDAEMDQVSARGWQVFTVPTWIDLNNGNFILVKGKFWFNTSMTLPPTYYGPPPEGPYNVLTHSVSTK